MNDYFEVARKRKSDTRNDYISEDLPLVFKNLNLEDNVLLSVTKEKNCIPEPKYQWINNKCIQDKNIKSNGKPIPTIPMILTKEQFIATKNISAVFKILEEICNLTNTDCDLKFIKFIKVMTIEQLWVYYMEIYKKLAPKLPIEFQIQLYNMNKQDFNDVKFITDYNQYYFKIYDKLPEELKHLINYNSSVLKINSVESWSNITSKKVFAILNELCKFTNTNCNIKNIDNLSLEKLWEYYIEIFKKLSLTIDDKMSYEDFNFTKFINDIKNIYSKNWKFLPKDLQNMLTTNQFASTINSWSLLNILSWDERNLYEKIKFGGCGINAIGELLIQNFRLQEAVLYYAMIDPKDYDNNIKLFRNHVLDIIYNHLPYYGIDYLKQFLNFNSINNETLSEGMFASPVNNVIEKLKIKINNGQFDALSINENCTNDNPFSYVLEPCIDNPEKLQEIEPIKLDPSEILESQNNVKKLNERRTDIYLKNIEQGHYKIKKTPETYDSERPQPLDYFNIALVRTKESLKIEDEYWIEEVNNFIEDLHESMMNSIGHHWYETSHFKTKIRNLTNLNQLLLKTQNILVTLELSIIERIRYLVSGSFSNELINNKNLTFSKFFKFNKDIKSEFYDLIDLRQAWYIFTSINIDNIYLFDYNSCLKLNYQLDYNFGYWITEIFLEEIIDRAFDVNPVGIDYAKVEIKDWVNNIISPKMNYMSEIEDFENKTRFNRSKYTFEPVRFVKGKPLNH